MRDKAKTILLAHGSGGQLGHELIEKVFARHFDNPILAELNDAALIRIPDSVLRPSPSAGMLRDIPYSVSCAACSRQATQYEIRNTQYATSRSIQLAGRFTHYQEHLCP